MEAAVIQIHPYNSPNRLSELQNTAASVAERTNFCLTDGVECAGTRLGVDYCMLKGIARALEGAHEWLTAAAQAVEEERVSLLQFAVAGISHRARQVQRVVREYLHGADLSPEGHQLVDKFSLLALQAERAADALSDGRQGQASAGSKEPFRDFLLQRAIFERSCEETAATLS